jgi:hypothetical protein
MEIFASVTLALYNLAKLCTTRPMGQTTKDDKGHLQTLTVTRERNWRQYRHAIA